VKLSTEFNYGSILFGTEAAIRLMAEVGFEALDYSMFDLNREDNPVNHDDWESTMVHFRRVAEECGISFNQTHATFPSFKEGDEDYNKANLPRLVRAIRATAALGAPLVVMHPQPTGGNDLEKNAQFFSSLAPYCKECGVKIAIENLIGKDCYCGNPGDLVALIDSLDSKCFTGLLDIGHASINGVGAPAFIKAMGGRLSALHVHDNDGVKDCHNMPYNRGLDWDAICTALGENDYKGDFTYEAGFYARQFPKELVPDAYRMMVATGKHLVAKVNYARANKK